MTTKDPEPELKIHDAEEAKAALAALDPVWTVMNVSTFEHRFDVDPILCYKLGVEGRIWGFIVRSDTGEVWDSVLFWQQNRAASSYLNNPLVSFDLGQHRDGS